MFVYTVSFRSFSVPYNSIFLCIKYEIMIWYSLLFSITEVFNRVTNCWKIIIKKSKVNFLNTQVYWLKEISN